jgi:V/A-type H+-transporting ATPase subunit E
MNDKLQELTTRIYDEGVEKGKKEAAEIVAKAKKESEEILKTARADAEKILADARQSSEELKKNTDSELQMTTRQAVTSIKQRITDLLVDKAVNTAVDQTFDDKDFVKKLLLKMADNWDKIEQHGKDLTVFMSEEDHKKLESTLTRQVAEKVKGGVDIDFEEGIKSGFKLGPKGGSYKISFTDEDFKLFFKQYLRPRTRKFFDENH